MRIKIIVLLFAMVGLTDVAHAQINKASSHEATKGATPSVVAAATTSGTRVTCTNGRAGVFACRNVDLLSYLSIAELGGEAGVTLNDIWGWTDPDTGREYALVGRSNGTAFVDVTDPVNPVYVASLPAIGGSRSVWRDIKTIGNYALIVMDYPSMSVPTGVQIFDLTRLRGVTDPPETFEEDAHYPEFARAHNIVVNEESGFAYAVGTETCGGGLHMIDVGDPLNPAFVGCFGESGYTHDAQCVQYHGPDAVFRDREICIGSNATHILIADVSDKSNVTSISETAYPSVSYTHQAWLTPDHKYLLVDDELDEMRDDHVLTTRTMIFDVMELEDPQLVTAYFGTERSTDHNQYVRGNRAFQANYTSGLRVIDISDIERPEEVGFFDTYPSNDDPGFDGAWSNYPFFESGTVVVSSIGEGLFVVEPTGSAATAAVDDEIPSGFELVAAYPNPFNPVTSIRLAVDRPQRVRVAVIDVQGREIAVLHDGFVHEAGVIDMTFDAADLASGVYLIHANGERSSATTTITLQK